MLSTHFLHSCKPWQRTLSLVVGDVQHLPFTNVRSLLLVRCVAHCATQTQISTPGVLRIMGQSGSLWAYA